MIKVKDGYAKLIGTTYQGSATQVLLSNGGDLEYSASSKASTLVQRNASQHIYATYFNSAISDEALTDIGSVYVRNTSDTFIRRVSKTQFYSILDDKFVTLDTTQSITGAKTFSTSVRFANNASIIQNQNDTSNYTTILKWYKNGASRNTYDPSIGQHNTGGDGNGSICILPYPTKTSPWDGTVGLFISKGVLKLDGKSVALAENYYTKTESDERYVNVTGDTMTGPLIVKAAITGTQLISTIATGTSPLKVTSTTVVTNLNSDLLDGLHETSFFRARGDQSIASSVPTTTELATSNNLCGSWNVKYTGASGHLVQFNAGSGSTRYMQFYSMYSGSLYWRNSTDSTLNTKSWKTIVDSANYTGIVLKIGTATKGSATLPIYLNAGTPTACSTTLGVSITGNAATASILKSSGNKSAISGTTLGDSGLRLYQVYSNGYPATYGNLLNIGGLGYGELLCEWKGDTSPGHLYYRSKRDIAETAWSQWVTVLDSSNYSSLIGNNYWKVNKQTTTGTGDIYLEMWRGVNASWKILNSGGNLYFQSNYTTTAGSYFNVLTLQYNSGNAVLRGMLTAKAHFVNTGDSTLKIYSGKTVDGQNDGCIAFQTSISGTDGQSHAYPTQYGNRCTIALQPRGGQVMIGAAPSGVNTGHKLYVQGGSQINGVLTISSTVYNKQLVIESTGTTGKNMGGGIWFRSATDRNQELILRHEWYDTFVAGYGFAISKHDSLEAGDANMFLYNTGRYISKVPTGTKPIDVVSTTLCNNLNADMVDGYHSSKLFRSFDGVSIDFNFNDNNNNNGLYYLHSDYTQLNKNGITYGSLMNFSSRASSWQIISGNDARLYYRNRWWSGGGGAWSSWKTIAYTYDIPSSLKNPYSLTLQTNGSTQTTYDGSSAKTFNVTVQNAGSGLLHNSLTVTLADTTTDSGWSMINSSYYGFILKSIRTQSSAPSWILGDYSAGICFGGADTKGVMSCSYGIPSIRFAGGNSSKPVWWMGITGSRGVTYNLANMWTGTRYWANIAVSTTSNIRTSPTFSTAYASDWFRSTGSTGWYSETYGGGIYMTDSTYVRVFNSKIFYASAGYLAPYYGSTWISMATRSNCIVADQNNSFQSAHCLFRVKYNNGNALCFGGIGDDLGFYGFSATNISNGTNSYTWIAKWNSGGSFFNTGSITAAGGFYHNSVNSNDYVLLAGGSYKSLADFVKGNAGAPNRGVYVTNGTVTAMRYYLNATVNSGVPSRLVYYNGTNSIDDYTSTVGSSNTPMYLSTGVPTVCSGVVIKYWAIYTIDSMSSTVIFTRDAGNYSFLTSITRMRDNNKGAYCVYCSYPSGYSWNNTIIWGSGSHPSEKASYPETWGSLYVSTTSGGSYYFYVRTSDDDSTNNGKFRLFMICF